jgi:hypothetical protein
MKNINIRFVPLILAALVMLTFTGCDDLFNDGEVTYDGPSKVEFKPESNTLTLSPDSSTTVPVLVQLIGEQRNEDLTVSFTVNEGSTAEEGTHYNLPSSSSVTIPAESSSAEIIIDAMGDSGLDPGDTVQLMLELQGTDQVEAAEELKDYTLTIQGGN